MSQVVMAGRKELVKIQTIRPDGFGDSSEGSKDDQQKTVPISRARRAASRLRSMKGTG